MALDTNLNDRFLPLRDVDTALLRTFVAVVEAGSLQKASEGVSRTQAAVSQQLKRLEDIMNATLFDRQGRRLVLTSTGERLVGYAQTLLEFHDEMTKAIRMEGNLRVGNDSAADLSNSFDNSRAQLVERLSAASNLHTPASVMRPQSFADNLRNRQHRAILDFWKYRGGSTAVVTLKDLAEASLLNAESDMGLLFTVKGSEVRCIEATNVEARDFGFDKHGFGAADEHMIEDSTVLLQRRTMYFTGLSAGVPVFYTGNAIMPEDSDIVRSDPTYITQALDRLLLPVAIRQPRNAAEQSGLLIVGIWDKRRSYGFVHGPSSQSVPDLNQFNVTEAVRFGF